MWKKLIAAAVAVLALGAVAAYALTAPDRLPASAFEGLGEPDLENGERIFHAGGCNGCHAAPDAEGEDLMVLSGGLVLDTEFGAFHVPNISPDPEHGIGDWSLEDFANAMKRGVAPSGAHLYPAFPYGSYIRMSMADINDLWGFLQTLPPSSNEVPPHELSFPYSIRRGVAVWKMLYLDDDPIIPIEEDSEQLARGRYLVEGPGHCGECHTPRDQLGGLREELWLAGAPNPDGDGRIPNITPGEGGIGSWTVADIVYYFETGFTPDFDTVGGSMAEVQSNLAELPPADREAIAAYLKAVPPQDTEAE